MTAQLKRVAKNKNDGPLEPVDCHILGLLKLCATEKDLNKGSKLHEYICEHKLLERPYIACTLISMYAKCGAFAKAQQVLKEIPARDVATWSALIAGYAQQGQGEEALKCFDSMQHEGHCPDAVTFTCALKACGSIGALAKGKEIHDQIVSLGILGHNIVVGNALVDMYAKCGAFSKAKKVLLELPARNVVTWSALIAGFANRGQGEEALNCFHSMQCDGHSPDVVTFGCALKACGSIGEAGKGEEIHDKIVSLGLLEKNVVLGNVLVDMYVKWGDLAKAKQVLEELSIRNVVTWSALIAGYVQHGQGEEALKCYDSMQWEGHSPNVVTYVLALKACGTTCAEAKGKLIHDKLISLGMLEKDVLLGSSLVDMYVKCGALVKAQHVLEQLPVRDVVTWSALIAGYAQQGQEKEALNGFDNMQCEGLSPNAVTFIFTLKACGSIGAAAKGEEMHKKVANLGMLKGNNELQSALVDMYAKCGAFAKAQQVLKELPVRDVVVWSTLMEGYAQSGHGEEALKCFDVMQHEGHSPDAVTFTCALKACASIGAAVKGEQFCGKIVNNGMLERDFLIGSTLVDMYFKCGVHSKALELVSKLSIQSLITWNALIRGFAQQGQSLEALDCFQKMQFMGLKPDSMTMIYVLNACSHSGFSDDAEVIFSKMSSKYGIKPDVKHYCCMVDLFGRTGKFNKALILVEEMPSAEYIPLWVALLGACHNWGEVKVATLAFEHALNLDKSNAGLYICMVNICRAAEMHKLADKTEVICVANNVYKMPSCW